VARYSQGLNIDEPLAMLSSATTSYYEEDGLGSITSLSSGPGSLAQTYTFDSFGKQTSFSGSLINPFQYTARESDPETGLYYYRARYYDTTAGRFIGEDSVGFLAGPNFYMYVSNSPVMHRDPTGQQQDEGWFWNTLNRLANWLLNPPKPKPGAPQAAPVNICNAGDTRLFYEAGPNPFAGNGKYRSDWVAFQSQFSQKCSAAKTPGEYTYPYCSAGGNFGGVYAFCECCEACEKK